MLLYAQLECNERQSAPAIHRLRHCIHEDFLFAGGDTIFPQKMLEDLIQFAAAKPNTFAALPISAAIDIAPEHAVIEASDAGEIRNISITGEVCDPENITHVDTGK